MKSLIYVKLVFLTENNIQKENSLKLSSQAEDSLEKKGKKEKNEKKERKKKVKLPRLRTITTCPRCGKT